MRLTKTLEEVGITIDDAPVIEQHGFDTELLELNIETIRAGPRYVSLIRAAGRDDVRVLDIDPAGALAQRFDSEVDAAPCKVTPMSGAASRMFKALRQGDRRAIERVLAGLDASASGPRFAFTEPLRRALAGDGLDLDRLLAAGDARTIVDYLLTARGLGLAARPKGVIPFHLRDGRPVTALEEHMEEALRYAGGQLYATISPEHRELFEKTLVAIRESNPKLAAVEVQFSLQYPRTDSVALDARTGQIVRHPTGEVAFFPGGHGALLTNIDELGRLAILRNVDNVPASDAAQILITTFHRAMAVIAAELKARIRQTLLAIEDGSVTQEALDETLSELRAQKVNLVLDRHRYASAPLAAKVALARTALDRPIKIVGVVENRGEPGGGPFFIAFGEHHILTVVEKDEISTEQKGMMRDGEFFSPVDILIDPMDHRGEPFDLTRFANQDRHFLVRKHFAGRIVERVEHPGLWNGAMEAWTSIFVTLPIETFAPVKEVVDLLRPAHQTDL